MKPFTVFVFLLVSCSETEPKSQQTGFTTDTSDATQLQYPSDDTASTDLQQDNDEDGFTEDEIVELKVLHQRKLIFLPK